MVVTMDPRNVPNLQSVTPSPGLSLEVTHEHNVMPDSITVTYSGTPTHAGNYAANFAYLQGQPKLALTQTIKVLCPTETTRQPDRTCLEDLVVPNSDNAYPVSFAALKGMRQAADEWVGKFQSDSSCGVIPASYRLTRNMLVATLVAIQIHEPGPSSLAPHSLMVLSRSDYYVLDQNDETPGDGNRKDNKILYSLNDPTDQYERAFWHPGVGLYQLDDTNEFGSKMNHVERAHAKTSAYAVLEQIHQRYCQRKAAVSSEALAKNHLDSSLLPWIACNDSQCLSMLDHMVEGDGGFFSNVESVDDKRLHLNVSGALIHEYGGGVTPRTCRWSTDSRDDTFECFMYDIGMAEGSVWLSDRVSGSATSERSPLAFPFLSFTGYLPSFNRTSDSLACEKKENSDWKYLKKFVVFRHEETGYTRSEVVGGETVERDVDLIAAVPCGSDVRGMFSGTGWWHMDEIDGASLVVE